MKVINKKGFTLIELLAVIVILAIIALIATPIILGIVEDARKDSFMRSVELVINATDIDIFNKNYNDTYTYTINDGNVSNLEIGVKNTDGMNGSITYDKNGNDIYAIHNGKYCVIKDEGMKKAEIKDYVEGECELIIPTDASYFIYEEMAGYEIADKDACVDWLENDGAENATAISMCSNEPQEWFYGITLAEILLLGNLFSEEKLESLKESGAIEEIANSVIEITGYSEEGPKDVVIPSRINGKEVVVIGRESFNNKELLTVEIPKSVKILKDGAFSHNSLQEVVISDGVILIDHNVFLSNDIQKITIPASVGYIGIEAFRENSLQQVIIENDAVEIGESAFCDNPIQDDPNSEYYQKIYSISPEALECGENV